MKEMIVRPGDRIDLACERLLKEAPAFMVFNGTRLEARPGDTVQAIYDRWNAARPEPVDEVAKLRAENALLRATLKTVLHEHDGSHGEDCDTFGSGADDDEDEACSCGATQKRDKARAVLAGLSEGAAPEVKP